MTTVTFRDTYQNYSALNDLRDAVITTGKAPKDCSWAYVLGMVGAYVPTDVIKEMRDRILASDV